MALSKKVKHVLGPVSTDKAEMIDKQFVTNTLQWWGNQPNTPLCRHRRLVADKVLTTDYTIVTKEGVEKDTLVLAYEPDSEKFHIARVTSVNDDGARVSDGVHRWAVMFAAVIPEPADIVGPMPGMVVNHILESAMKLGKAMAVMDDKHAMLVDSVNNDGRYSGTMVMFEGTSCKPTKRSTNPKNVSMYVSGQPPVKGTPCVAMWKPSTVQKKEHTKEMEALYLKQVKKIDQMKTDEADPDGAKAEKALLKKKAADSRDANIKDFADHAGYYPGEVIGKGKTGTMVVFADGEQLTVPIAEVFSKL